MPTPNLNSHSQRNVLALLLLTGTLCAAIAAPGDEICFPLYRKAGAIPGTQSCPLTASTASVTLDTYFCTASSGTARIDRFCGTLPKKLQICPSTNNPIAIGNANKWWREVDDVDPEGMLSLTRSYNSTPVAVPGSMLGNPWRLGFEMSLVISSNGSVVSAVRDDGQSLTFTSAAGAYAPNADVNDRLVRLPTTGTLLGWRYTDAGKRRLEDYDATGRMTSITRSDGRRLDMAYTGTQLTAVTDNFGRILSISYNAQTRKTLVTASGGRAFLYSMDADKNLISVDFPDGKSKRYLYNETPFNGGVAQVQAVTGIVDENGARHANYTYDTTGRAVREQLLASGAAVVGQNDLNFDGLLACNASSTAISDGGRTVVTDPLRSSYVYGFSCVRGVPRSTGVSQPGGAGCLASNSAITYDTNGNVASEDDFAGNRSCSANDLTRNLEITRVEGVSNTASCSAVIAANASLPAGARKTSTQWHPDWRIESARAEPGKRITNVYHGQPDPFNGNAAASCAPPSAVLPGGKPIAVLCKRVEQATTDTDGHLGFTAPLQSDAPVRVQSWTYNPYGQVITAKGSRTDVNDVTQYTYYSSTSFIGTDPSAAGHTLGDRQTMTDASGKVTTYTQYNKTGQLLEMMDVNGVAASYTYDPRQRPASATLAGLTVTYEYWPTGLLKKITQADASFISYEYDDAHRLKAVQDGLGNRVEYTRDAADHITEYKALDSNGLLRQQVTRNMDALGRVQTITGRE